MPPPLYVSGTEVRKKRQELGWTQRQLADHLGFASVAPVSNAEVHDRAAHDVIPALEAVLGPLTSDRIDPSEYAAIGTHIRAARVARLLTAKDLVDRTGLCPRTIQKAENGTWVTATTIRALRAILDLPADMTEHNIPEVRPRRLAPPSGIARPRVPADMTQAWTPAGVPCATAEVGVFDPIDEDEHPHAAWHRVTTKAGPLCATCPVLTACRQVAVDNQLEGVWGGALFRTYPGQYIHGTAGLIEHRLMVEMVRLEREVLPSHDVALPEERRCLLCGTAFRATGRARATRKFCSARCRGTHNHRLHSATFVHDARAYGVGSTPVRGRGKPLRPKLAPGNFSSEEYERFKRSFHIGELRSFTPWSSHKPRNPPARSPQPPA